MSPSKRLLIKGATIISMDPSVGDLRQGDILIEDGLLAEIAPEVEASDSEVIDAGGMIAMPGLIDSHRHLWYTPLRSLAMDKTMSDMIVDIWPKLGAQYTPEDVYAATRAGAVDALDHGITTVFDWCHIINTPEHGEEALRALRSLPGRVVFAYGASMTRKLDEFADNAKAVDGWDGARRMREQELSSDDGLVTMALALQGPEYSTAEIAAADIAVARELGVPMSMHVGVPDGAAKKRAISVLAEAGLLASDMQFVHCCTTDDEEFRSLAKAGAVVSISPMAELSGGMGVPPTARVMAAGLRPTFGADAVVVASGDQFDEARIGLLSVRRERAEALFARGEAVAESAQLGMSSRDALEAITIDSANACFLGDRVGSLSPGKQADVVLLRTGTNLSPLSDAVRTVVSCGHGANVDTVLVGGNVVKRDGELVGVDLQGINDDLVASRDRLFAAEGYEGMDPPVARPAAV